jgi:hypothetical protein
MPTTSHGSLATAMHTRGPTSVVGDDMRAM